ncbi:MAG: hypothetical protein HYR91_01410 [Flavobacteriia bacterium]|nr:hypothetical protein [Flavobacteriia bacterium]
MKLFFCFLTLFFVFVAHTQTSYRFRNYTISDGLSQSSVSNIIQDHTNALWIGTQDGLNRFDGKSFEIFNSDNTKGIESEYIKCSAKSGNGQLWFGTANGLTNYNIETERFETYSFQKNTVLQIESITVDEQNNLWLASSSHGLLKFNTKTKNFTSFKNSFPSKRTQSVIYLGNNSLLINTEDAGVYFYDILSKKTLKLIIPFKHGTIGIISKIIRPNKDLLFFCTNEGLFQYQISTHHITPKFQKLFKEYGFITITDIHLTDDKNWILTSGNEGLFTITSDGLIFHNTEDIFQKHALLNNKLSLIFIDNAGTYWIGSERGLSSFNPKRQDFLGVGPSGNLEQGLPSATVWCFGEDQNSNYLYIGTDSGISIYNKKKRKYTHCFRNNDNQVVPVRSIYVLEENHLLAGCDDGLFELFIYGDNSYRYQKVEFAKGIQSLTHNRIYSIIKWKEQKYFLGTKAGVVLYDFQNRKSVIFEHNEKSKSISVGLCRLVFKNKQGKIFFATSTGGLNVLETKNNKIRVNPYKWNSELKNLSKDYITSYYQISEFEYYFGTLGSGLIYWNEKTHTGNTLNKSNGLPNNVIYSVLPDKKNNLWLSSNKGLSCYNIKSKKITNYEEIHGLMSNEFNLGAYLQSKSGLLYFGGIYGFNFFNPSNLGKQENNIKVVFSKIKLDNNWLKTNEENSPLKNPLSLVNNIELSYKERSFTIQFVPSDLSNPELTNYKYLLEGSDEGEVLIGNENQIRLASLSPGEYRLMVYTRIGNEKWNATPSILNIVIAPPFWWTWWFWLIIGLILFGLVRLFIKQKIELERRKLVRLEMKIAERTREIRAKNAQIEAQNIVIENEKNKVIEQQRLLQIEKDKSERLILKIMPESTVKELKDKGTTSARAYKKVSVLFTDFVGFTKKAEQMKPSELVSKLDVYFRKFDDIIVKNNLEKIKTIGDAYMCAGGVPVRNNTNPIDTTIAALQIQDYMSSLKEECIKEGREEDIWMLRLGINTGEVTAGVIGSERLAYDIWGATVNRAQRMEMLGEPGKVTVTGETYKLIEPFFECVFRGKVQSKSKEFIEMYTVERIKVQLSEDQKGIIPNERFHQIVNLYLYSSINYNKAERHITKVLEKGLSDKLHYHSLEHMKDVVQAVENIALTENVTDEGLFLLKSAASYHDAGFIEQYDKNEPIGARLAEEILPKYGYTEQHIQQIKELIYVTQIPHNPKNKLEEIICDADLDYLGRDDFEEIADKLRIELREHGKINSDRKWDEIQVQFLTNHRYFTQTAINTRKAKKIENLEKIKQRLLKNNYKD